MQDYSKYHELLELSLKLKEKGHDCFFLYYPHSNCFKIQLYKNGWDVDKDFDNEFIIYDDLNPELTYEAISYLLEVENGQALHQL